jgi:hypothetical protein
MLASTIRGMALESLSDEDVLTGLHDVLRQSRRVESSLIAHLAEVDARPLFARYAVPSMFLYCRDVLHLSEGEAQLRINVARAATGHPILLAMLADGRLPRRSAMNEARDAISTPLLSYPFRNR